MKKPQLILFALVMFHSSCESPEDAVPIQQSDIDYQQVSDGFQQMFEGAFKLTEVMPMISVMDRNQKQITVMIEANQIQKTTQQYIETYFGSLTNLNQKPSHPYLSFLSHSGGVKDILILEHLIDTTRVFDEAQRELVKDLSAELLTSHNYEDGYRSVSIFRNKVLNSKELSEWRKVELLQLAAGSKALIEFFESAGLELIQKNLSNRLGSEVPIGRIATCGVDWRGAWMDGVIGLTFGAASGFYAGALGGSVVMPIVGTVTGAVNGAVIGGAIGFTTGVLQGIASDLLLSCSRNTSPQLAQSFASCELAWEAYRNNKTNQIPSDCFEFRFTF